MTFSNYIKNLQNAYVINQVKQIKLPYFEPSPQVRKKIIFSGRVQKVGFRLEIYELSKLLNLTGWVRNRVDKNVEAEIQGENEKINFLIKFMQSLKRASVHHIVITDMLIVGDEGNFSLLNE